MKWKPKTTDPTVYRDSGEWLNGAMTVAPALRVQLDLDQQILEILDSRGPLLSLSFDQAAKIADEIGNALGAVRR